MRVSECLLTPTPRAPRGVRLDSGGTTIEVAGDSRPEGGYSNQKLSMKLKVFVRAGISRTHLVRSLMAL